MGLLYISCVILLPVFIISRVTKYWHGRKAMGTVPIMSVPFAPFSLLGSIIPTLQWNPGMVWQWKWREQVYSTYGSETIAIVPWLFGRPSIYTSSLEVARQVLSTKEPFEKRDDATSAVLQYGENIFTSNGSEWRRHLRILGPAFNNETYNMVWEVTSSLYREMTSAEGWDKSKSLTLPTAKEYLSRFALTILSRCAFGNDIPWSSTLASTEKMDFREALEIVMGSCILRLLMPKWMFKLPIPSLQKIEIAHQTMCGVMHKMISDERKSVYRNDTHMKKDVFSLMVRAREVGGKLTMTDEEILGNTFFLLFAGHETLSHIWNATFAFLALHGDIQEEAYETIVSVAPGNTPLTYDMASQLQKVLALFLEAGRLYPPGFILVRDTTESVVLPIYDKSGECKKMVLGKDVRVAIDMVGLHFNPRHFPEPNEYRPSRWYDVPETELSIFSLGPRACTGRKFATTEACCFLAHLLRDWRIKPLLKPGENLEQWKARVLVPHVAMTLGLGDVPVTLSRR